MHSESGNIDLDKILRLKLKRPNNWRWELTTSKSSPNIAIPIIQLLDQNGELLAEANEPNGCIRHSWHSSPNTRTQSKVKLKSSHSLKVPIEISDQSEILQNHVKSKSKSSHKFKVPIESSDQLINEKSKSKSKRSPKIQSLVETNQLDDPQYLEMRDIIEDRYQLCSSNAGTLVVRADSLDKNIRRRSADLNINKFGNFFEKSNDSEPAVLKHRKSRRTPKAITPDYRIFNKKPLRNWDKVEQPDLKSDLKNSEHMKYKTSNDLTQVGLKVNPKLRDVKVDNSDYTVQEPITPSSADVNSKKFSFRKLKPKRKLIRTTSTESTASSNSESLLEYGNQKKHRRRKKG